MNINLLPEKEKKVIKKEKNWKKAFSILVFVLIFFLILAFTLASFRNLIIKKIEATSAQIKQQKARMEDTQMEDFEKLTEKVNSTLFSANKFLNKNIENYIFIEDLIKYIPDSIYITSISFNKKIEVKNKKTKEKEMFVVFDIKGTSKTREELFNFKERLEEKSNLRDIKFRTSSWVEPENAEFYLEFKTPKYSID